MVCHRYPATAGQPPIKGEDNEKCISVIPSHTLTLGCIQQEARRGVWRTEEGTYIGVVAELLNHIWVEVTSVALEGIADGEGVLEATKDLANERVIAATLSQLEVLRVAVATLVDLLDPRVVVDGARVIDVILELDDVRVWDVVGVDAAEDRSRVTVDGLGAEGAGRGDGSQGESGNALHGDGKLSG